jgi:prepilin peptidase CpaA
MLIVFAILTFLMLMVVLSDIARYLIPNWLVLSLMALYPVAVYIAPHRPDWQIACLIAFITLLVGYLVLLRYMGGGDIKLLTATALYAGKAGFGDFIVLVAIIGGLGTLLLLLLRALTPYVFLKAKKTGASVPRVLTPGEPVPYGVAIAAAFLYMLWNNQLPGLAV